MNIRRALWARLRAPAQALARLGIGRIPYLGRGYRQVDRAIKYMFLPRGSGVVSIRGHYMDVGDWSLHPDPDLLFASYEEGTTNIFERLLKEGMAVVDVGANLGYYTLLAARLVGESGKVYAFEPDPTNYALLTKNIQRNGYANVMVFPLAVSDKTGCAELFLNTRDSSQHSLYRVEGTAAAPLAVCTVTLDDFFSNLSWPRLDFVKLDIEGAEPAALRGMGRLLKKFNRLKLIIEFAPNQLRAAGVRPGLFLNELQSRFKTQIIDNQGCAEPLSFLKRSFLLSGGYCNLFCER